MAIDWGGVFTGGKSAPAPRNGGIDWGGVFANTKEPDYWSNARSNNFDWNKLDQQKQRQTESAIFNVLQGGGANKTFGGQPYLTPGYTPGAVSSYYPSTNVTNQNLGNWGGLAGAFSNTGTDAVSNFFPATKQLGYTAASIPLLAAETTALAAKPIFTAGKSDAYKKGYDAELAKAYGKAMDWQQKKGLDPTGKIAKGDTKEFAKTLALKGTQAGFEIAPLVTGGSLSGMGIKEASVPLLKGAALSSTGNIASSALNGNYKGLSAADTAKAAALDAAVGAGGEILGYAGGRLLKAFSGRGGNELVDTLAKQTSPKAVTQTLKNNDLYMNSGLAKQLASANNKKEVVSLLSKSAQEADRSALVARSSIQAPIKSESGSPLPSRVAEDFYPEGSPKRAAYEALSSTETQGDKFSAGVKAFKEANPKATDKEAKTAVFEVLDDINQRSVGTIRTGLANTEPGGFVAKSGAVAKIREIFNPIKNLEGETKQSFVNAAGAQYASASRRTAVVNELRQLAKKTKTKLDLDLARNIEDGTAPDTEFTREFRKMADDLRQEAVDNGIDIGYRENYVPHIWKKSPEQVDQIARTFGMKPRAAGQRIVPTYEEGIAMGLKPKYKDPAEMMGDYVNNIQSARANVALVTDLNKQGLLLEGRPPAGFKSITAEGFPRSATGGQMSAPTQIADIINNIYGSGDSIIEKALGKTARFNSVWQDIALAGGIPKTPANFFTFSQMVKEMTTGVGQTVALHPIQGIKQIYTPLAAFTRSFSKNQTAKFQVANKDFLEDLARRGAPLNFSTHASKWDSLFNDPTFGRFMPSMQLGTAKNVYSALEKKVGHDEAMQKTADAMKRLYGITDKLATGRSGAVQDLIGTVGFAPKYRESIVNVLGNTVKSIADPRTYKDQSYSLNRRLALGMGVTLLAYDQLNRQTTGHGLLQNPEGKELQLAIPYGDGKAIYIPFMPSFMTIPRSIVAGVQDVAKGDLGGLGSEVGKMLSMPIQTGTQLVTNRDYFGRPIVNDEKASQETGAPIDSPLDMLKKRGLYVLGQSSPAVVRGGLDYAQGKPLEQVLAGTAEAPVRFGNLYAGSNKDKTLSKGEVSGGFYNVYNVMESQARRKEKDINKDIYGGNGGGSQQTAAQFNDSVDKKFAPFFDKYGKYLTAEDRKKYENMVDNIKIDVKAKKKGGFYINKY